MKKRRILIPVLIFLVLGGAFLYHILSAQTSEAPTGDADETSIETPGADGVQESAPMYQVITAEAAWQMMDGEEPYILLDVRTPEEFQEAHIADALLIPYQELAERAQIELPDQDMRILIYCRSGRRSREAAQILWELGYAKVYDFGGILDWPHEVVRGGN